MNAVSYLSTAQDHVRNLRDTRLSSFRSPREFLDFQRVSVPRDMGEYFKRASYNIRYFSANYLVVFILFTLFFVLADIKFLFAIAFLAGGYYVLSRFVTEPFDIAGKTITPQNLWTVYFVLGLILLYFAGPISMVLSLVFSTGIVIALHAGLLEPGVESEYEGVETV